MLYIMNEDGAEHSTSKLKDAPIGLRLIGKANVSCDCFKASRDVCFQALVLILTYLGFASIKLAIKPSSVVKNVLNRNCSDVVPGPGDNITDPSWCHWEPFTGDNAETLLGLLDSSLLIGYAVAMFISGWLAERLPLRYFLSCGMSCGAICSILLGFAYFIDMHSIYYFLILQTCVGVFLSTGWPSMVKCVNNWFPKKNRGLVFGAWSSHLFIGGILGKIIPGAVVEQNWGLSFMIPGLILFTMGVLSLLFLPTEPAQVSCTQPDSSREVLSKAKEDETKQENIKAISLLKAIKIPGVLEYSGASFCTKLVTYALAFWLTRYIKLTTTFSARDSAYLSVFYDVGGIIGSTLCGFISDRIGSRSVTCAGFQILTVPAMFLYWYFGNTSLALSIVLLHFVGILVNGPYTIIVTSVVADLGSHNKAKEYGDAMATVAGFINGCGSIGGAVGPFLAGFLTEYSIDNVFWMLVVANILGCLCLLRLIIKDVMQFFKSKSTKKMEEEDPETGKHEMTMKEKPHN